MADSKLTGLTELAANPAEDDWLYIVDKSDTTDDAAGSSKKIEASRVPGQLTQTERFTADGSTGAWGIPGAISTSTGTDTTSSIVDWVFCAPFWVGRSLTITDASILVVTAQASSNVRVGIYNANQSTGEITTLVSDIGTRPTTSTGAQTWGSLSISLTPGLYYTVHTSDTSSVTYRAVMTSVPWAGQYGHPTTWTQTSAFAEEIRSNSATTPYSSGFPSDATSWTWSVGVASTTPGVEQCVFFKW